MLPKQILIYQDKGVDPFCLKALVCSLQQELIHKTHPLAFADRHLLKTSSWHKSTKLLVFPGGRDIPYQKALQGLGNEQIVDFVQKGGSFLGICAGGYYGSAFIEFEKGGPLEVIAKRDLCFFPGIARGPAYGLGEFNYRDHTGAQIAHLEIDSTLYSSYYHGGCAFVGAENNPNVSIFARYADLEAKPPAIVHCTVGQGQAILSGVHPEYSSHLEDARAQIPSILFSDLLEIEPLRRHIFRKIIEKLIV